MDPHPLKVVVPPTATPQEAAAAEALAVQTGWPPKMCRAALIRAGGDPAKAAAQLQDWQFVTYNTDYDDPACVKAADRFMRRRAAEKVMRGPTEKQKREFEMQQALQPRIDALVERAEKAKGTKLKDSVLGALKWDYLWEGKANVPPFGKMSMTIDTTDDSDPEAVATPPGEAHREALRQFASAAESLYPEIERANFDYFRRVRQQYVESFGEKHVPDVKRAADLWKELGKPSLHLPPQDGKKWRVEINWGCSWDEEHGHAAYVEGGKIVSIGLQGEGWAE